MGPALDKDASLGTIMAHWARQEAASCLSAQTTQVRLSIIVLI